CASHEQRREDPCWALAGAAPCLPAPARTAQPRQPEGGVQRRRDRPPAAGSRSAAALLRPGALLVPGPARTGQPGVPYRPGRPPPRRDSGPPPGRRPDRDRPPSRSAPLDLRVPRPPTRAAAPPADRPAAANGPSPWAAGGQGCGGRARPGRAPQAAARRARPQPPAPRSPAAGGARAPLAAALHAPYRVGRLVDGSDGTGDQPALSGLGRRPAVTAAGA